MEYWQGEKELKIKKDSQCERNKIFIAPQRLKEGFFQRARVIISADTTHNFSKFKYFLRNVSENRTDEGAEKNMGQYHKLSQERH